MYNRMFMIGKPTSNEVILEGAPVFLYLDIDITLDDTDSPFTFEEVDNLISYIKAKLITHINSSCASYVAELNEYFKDNILRGETRTRDTADDILSSDYIVKSRLRKHIDFIDLSVYKKSQQFRCLGSSKLDKNRPLLEYTGTLRAWTDRVDGWFTAQTFNLRDWMKTLVTVKEPETVPLVVIPSPYSPFTAPLMARHRLYTLAETQDDILTTGRYLTATAASSSLSSSSSAASASATTQTGNAILNIIKTRMLPFSQGRHSITDDACLFVDEFQKVRSMMSLQVEERLYCLMCETNTVDYKGTGVCSAKSFLSKSGEKAIFCFNCSATVFILECGDQYGFHPLNDEIIRTSNTKLNYNGSDDINLATCKRVVFLDAPMGTGKTFLAKNYISSLDSTTTVLSITFRVSLAKYLANEFNINCYLDDGIWDETSTQSRERLVICLDSILKLKEDEEYNVLVIDEATFVQYHLVAGTIPSRELSSVLNKLKTLLQNADKVIFMQHRIPDASINFYCNLLGYDPYNRNIVTKRKFDLPTILQPLKKWPKLSDMISYMIKDYMDSFKTDDQKSSGPFIIFCSRVDFSLALLQIFRSVAGTKFGATAMERIKGVWAQVQNDPWCSRFLTNPNSAAMDCDILIVTNVLQAGHSLDTHFVTSYDILFNNVLSFREELQFISRLRYLGRTDVRTTKHAWIKAGRSNQHITNLNKLRQSLSSLVSDHHHVDYNLILSTMSSVNSEPADSSNRHTFLWSEEYRRSDVALVTDFVGLDINSDFDYTPAWVDKQIKHYIKGTGASSIKNVMQLMNKEELTDLNGLLDEMQYCNVAELMLLHVIGNTKTLKEGIKCPDTQEGSNVVTNIFNVNKPGSLVTAPSISSNLMPYYNFICFMDYRLYLLSGSDPVKKKWWENRLLISNTNKVSVAIKLEVSKFLNTIGTLLGICTSEFGIVAAQIQQVDATTLYNIIEQNSHNKHYTNIFHKNNNYNADKRNYIKGGGSFTINRY